MNIISNLLLSYLCLASNINVIDALCTINDVLGETYYITKVDACWKLQLFQGGTLERDSTDPTCSNPGFTSGGVYSEFDSVNIKTNVFAFKDGPMEHSGTFKFSEAADVSEQGAKFLSWNRVEKEYELEVVFPSCEDVSTSCTINDELGETYYFSAENTCWKLQLFEGGTLEGDPRDPWPCTSSSFISGEVDSKFDSIDKETNLVVFKDTSDYSLTVKLSEAADVSEQGAKFMYGDLYYLEIVLPSCKDVSTSCSINDVMGETYYFAAEDSCWKLQLFEGGTLEEDFSDPTCSNRYFTSAGVSDEFDYVADLTNVVVFKKKADGSSLTIKFSEAADVSEQGAKFMDGAFGELEIVLPSCKDVSTSCTINDVYGSFHYFAKADACWKVQLYEGGTLEGDFTDPTCSNPTFNSGGVFSEFDSVDRERNVIAFKDGPMGYSGTFKFSKAEDASKQGAKFLSWNRVEKEYELEVVKYTCDLAA